MGIRARGRLGEKPAFRGYGTSRLGIFHSLSLPAKNLRQGSGGPGGLLVATAGRNQTHNGAPPVRPPASVRPSRASPGRAYAPSLLVLQGSGKRNGSRCRGISFSLPLEFHSRDLAAVGSLRFVRQPGKLRSFNHRGTDMRGLPRESLTAVWPCSRRNGIESLEKGCYALRQGISGRALRRRWRSPLSKGICIVPGAARGQRLDFGRWKS
jgi:hypothetical protein